MFYNSDHITKINPSISINSFSYLQKVRELHPFIVCFSNIVTAHDCANLLLAANASPVMADDLEGIQDYLASANAVTLNLGTIHSWTEHSMKRALEIAISREIPSILDPVGCACSESRLDLAIRLLNSGVSVLRCNISEAMALCGLKTHAKGPDANENDKTARDVLNMKCSTAFSLARKFHCVVVVTGEVDVVSDGSQYFLTLHNGHPIMEKITGSGCMLTALLGAFAAADYKNLPYAVASGITTYDIAAEIAVKQLSSKEGPGTFSIKILDAYYSLTKESVLSNEKVQYRKYTETLRCNS